MVVGVHDGLRLRCALHEESLLDIMTGKELDMIRSGGVFFVAARP